MAVTTTTSIAAADSSGQTLSMNDSSSPTEGLVTLTLANSAGVTTGTIQVAADDLLEMFRLIPQLLSSI